MVSFSSESLCASLMSGVHFKISTMISKLRLPNVDLKNPSGRNKFSRRASSFQLASCVAPESTTTPSQSKSAPNFFSILSIIGAFFQISNFLLSIKIYFVILIICAVLTKLYAACLQNWTKLFNKLCELARFLEKSMPMKWSVIVL